MTADPFDALIGPLLQREGGYSNRPDDAGGETCWGITVAVARRYGYQGPMRALPQDVAKHIYRSEYWTAPGFDEIAGHSVPIAAQIFDCGVNEGVEEAGIYLQRVLNVLNHNGADYPDVTVDGSVGPATVGALEAFLHKRGAEGERVVLRGLICLRGAGYITLAERRPMDENNVYGWLANRIGVA